MSVWLSSRPARLNAGARLTADAVGLVAGIVAAVVTARYLGPDGKGLFAVLTYVVGIVSLVATLGIGEAEIFFTNRGLHRFEDAVVTGLVAVLVLGVLGGIVFVVAMTAYLGTEVARGPVLLAAGAVPLTAWATTISQLHNARERFLLTSSLAAAMSVVSASLTWLFIGPLGWGVSGALTAVVLVPVVGLAAVLPLLREARGGALRWRYAREAGRFGFSLVWAGALMALAGRADLLVVDRLLGSSDAGLYSVALTIAALPTYGASAVAFVAFPRLSRGGGEASDLTGRLSRVGLLSAVLASVALALVAPVAIPVLFGESFIDSTGPALLLLVGAPLWALHLVLGRATAAGGRPGLLSRSYVVTLVVMLLIDAILVPRWGLIGAALASSVAPLAGLVLLGRWFVGARGSFRALVPGRQDLLEILSVAKIWDDRRTRP